MKKSKNMSIKEYRRETNQVRGSRSSTVHTSDSESDFEQAYNEAKQTLRYIQGIVSNVLLTGTIAAEIVSNGNTRADVDNIIKAALDSAQGVVFKNDQQVKKIYGDRQV